MFILTYNLYPELPKSKSKFYWNVFDTLCTKHDSYTKKGGFLHERKSGLQNEELENVLKWLAYATLFEGKYAFDEQYLVEKLKVIREKLKLNFDTTKIIEDFVVSISIIILDGFEYKFPHKSLQEYLAALLIREQSEEAKSKVYYERFASIEGKITGSNQNLWSICIELDKHSFYKNFFIKHLRKFLSTIKRGGSSKVMNNFYNFLDTGEGITIKNSKINFISFGVSTEPIFPILEFFGSKFSEFDFVLSHEFNNKEELSSLFLEFCKEQGDKLRQSIGAENWIEYKTFWDWSPKVDELISASSLKDIVQDFIRDAENILKRIEEDIAEDSQIKNDLLDL